MQKIHEHITSYKLEGDSPRIIAILGIGGVGKTQLVQEYAYRYHKEFSSILWVKANSAQSVVASYCAIAQRIIDHSDQIAHEIGLTGLLDSAGRIAEDSVTHIIGAVKRWLMLKGNSKWLLLFDNADDMDYMDIHPLIPAVVSGAVIITSRRQECARFGYSMEMDEMDEEEALILLSRSFLKDYGVSNTEGKGRVYDEEELLSDLISEHNAAKAIVKVLGNLPLAIDQAGAYIHRLRLTATRYLSHLEKKASHVLSQRPPYAVWPYRETVFITWEISLQAIKIRDPEAAELLQVCAFLSGEDISEKMLSNGF